MLNSVWIAENDIRHSFKSIRNVTWTFLFPVFMMLIFSFRWGIREIDPEYMSFLVPGIVGMTAMFGATNETLSIVWDRTTGTFDRILAAPVSSTSIILGKIMSGTLMGFISAIVMIIIGAAFYNVLFGNIAIFLLVITLSCLSFTGIGTIISGLASEPREASMLMNILRFPMTLLSGVFFPVEATPFPLPLVARALPLTYAIEAIRSSSGEPTSIVYFDITVLVVYALVTILVGSRILLRIITR